MIWGLEFIFWVAESYGQLGSNCVVPYKIQGLSALIFQKEKQK